MDLFETSKRFFDELEDNDFYGDTVNHIYFYGPVTPESVVEVQENIFNAQRNPDGFVEKKAKAIVLHMDSPGGHGSYGVTLMNILSKVRVPFAVVVDGYACSAATPLLVSAPYRVMNEYSTVLIHEGGRWMSGKDQDLAFAMGYFSKMDSVYMKSYLDNTNISEDYLKELVTRDKFIGSDECLELGIVDRVLTFDPKVEKNALKEYYSKNKEYKLPKELILQKTNFNNIYYLDKNLLRTVMEILKYSTSGENVKPLILHVNGDAVNFYQSNETIAYFVHLRMLKIPTISVIENDVDLMTALPFITCSRRMMHDTVFFIIHMVYYHRNFGTLYYNDIMNNFELNKNIILDILRKYTKMPKKILDKIFTTRMILTAQECKEYGLVDEIIQTGYRTRGK